MNISAQTGFVVFSVFSTIAPEVHNLGRISRITKLFNEVNISYKVLASKFKGEIHQAILLEEQHYYTAMFMASIYKKKTVMFVDTERTAFFIPASSPLMRTRQGVFIRLTPTEANNADSWLKDEHGDFWGIKN